MLKYCENGLDRERRLAREDAEKNYLKILLVTF